MKTLFRVLILLLLPVLLHAADYSGTATGPELDYVHGVTGPVQAQLNNQQSHFQTYSGNRQAEINSKLPATSQAVDSAKLGGNAPGYYLNQATASSGDVTWAWNTGSSSMVYTMAALGTAGSYGFGVYQFDTKGRFQNFVSRVPTFGHISSVAMSGSGGSLPWKNISSAVLSHPMNVPTSTISDNSATGLTTGQTVNNYSFAYHNWSTSLRANKTAVAGIIGATGGGSGSNNGLNGYGGVLSGNNQIRNGYWYQGPATSQTTQTFRSYSTGKQTAIFLPMSTSICPDSAAGTISWVNPTTNVATSASAGYCVNASPYSKVDIWSIGSNSYQVVATTRNLLQGTNPYLFSFTDNFSGSAGNINTANWTMVTATAMPQLTGSGTVRGNGIADSWAVYTGSIAPANQNVEFDGINYNGIYTSTIVAVIARGSATTTYGYVGWLLGNSSGVVSAGLESYGPGTDGAGSTHSITGGTLGTTISPSNKYSKIKLDVQGTGASTTLTFTGWNGSSWDTFYSGNDTSTHTWDSGQPGIRLEATGGYPTVGPFKTGTP